MAANTTNNNNNQHDDDDGTNSLNSFVDLQVIDSGRGVAIEDSHLPSTLPGVTTTDIISDAPAGGGGGGDAVEEQVPDYACHIRRTKGSETWISSYFDGREPVKEPGGEKDDHGETASVADLAPQTLVFKIIKTIYHRRDSSSSEDSYSDTDTDSGTEGSVSPDIEVLGDGSSSIRTVAQMVICSEHLRHAVYAVLGPMLVMQSSKRSVKIKAPYEPLVHNREALRLYQIAQPQRHSEDYAATTFKHIGVLLDFLEKTSGRRVGVSSAREQSKPLAMFDWLWFLFRPGEVVYCRVQNDWKPAVIQDVQKVTQGMPQVYGEPPNTLRLTCWNFRFFHGRMVRDRSCYSIKPFVGEQSIYSLDVIPAGCFRSDPDKLSSLGATDKKHILMGKLYWELVKQPSYKEYDGKLFSSEGEIICNHIASRVIVDASEMEPYDEHRPRSRTFRPQIHPIRMPPMNPKYAPPSAFHTPRQSCRCKVCFTASADRGSSSWWIGLDDLDPLIDEPPKDDLYYLVCSSLIPVFVLSSREWELASVENLSDVSYNPEAFEHLVLDPSIKLTVKALVGKFASTGGQVSPWPKDVIRNKGEGRIFLLHGSPGVGKTCTAECVAELTRRPLLSITSGDLAGSIETNLERFLELGERYGAVVLLDEADVYLEARRPRDLRRNALVSVFLRALEYYRGVLFLTTNRVASFDPAFTSRIHVALHYRRLTDGDRRRIWTSNFERLERDSAGKVSVGSSARSYVVGDVREIGPLRWNGREIRNALQTAVALAETEAAEDGLENVRIEERHLRQVAKMSEGFQTFMSKVRQAEGEIDEDEDYSEEESSSATDSIVD